MSLFKRSKFAGFMGDHTKKVPDGVWLKCPSCHKAVYRNEVAENHQESLTGMADEEINLKWQEMMASYFENPEGSRPDENLIELEEVFHLD